MENRNRKRLSVGKVLLILLIVLLALAAITAVMAWAYLNQMLGRIERVQPQQQSMLSPSEAEALEETAPTREEGYTGPVYEPEDITWPSEPPEEIKDNRIVNILLIGQDRRPGEPRQRSDAMILCTLNLGNKTITLTSFLRDMYVKIPGYNDNKINAAYQFGGMELLDATLEVNFGIHVDGNIEVDFSQFKTLIDLMGGVDIALTEAEANYINNRMDSALKAGMNHLNGEEALQYSRIRYIGTDFGRTQRQRTVLTALFEQCKGASVAQLHTILGEACGLITTDMSNAQIMDFFLDVLSVLDGMTIRSQRVPMDDSFTYGDINGRISCLFVDFEANREMLLRTLLPDDQENP